ncbi:NAD-dependent epimerase/dehydratase [Candidatus Nitrosopumilus koreensis AR1]|uniref:NAD-dependent epimerase/dehydratase n=1 Tax=Candidatus Nitrosopumilus koreensis AR1 TaxID=1229908 RepID=K0B4C1_9ARCH|nr:MULTISPECIES: NAD(P)H-binding protein [Nitrosopumilus]AFS80993.1 NAD-dependent epimerase/dehydratase [Candidatus Nitrosopumilus koreensis AR1]
MKETLSINNAYSSRPFSILVTGATGFIGSRLISLLSSLGYSVKGLTRKQLPDSEKIKYVQADVFKFDELKNAMSGIDTAFYLLHSMEGDKGNWLEFVTREKIQAQNFLRSATESGVKRIIYLGGLVNDSLELSPHMRSRKEVGEILASGNIPVTEFRASIIIGAKGGSYAMLRYLVERLRIMVCPSWVKSLAQPIAVDDVIYYLAESLSKPETVGKIFEIGGPDKMTYEELMRVYSTYINKNLFVLHIPFLTTRLSSYWVDLITPVKASLARPLIDSLVHDTVVTDDSIKKIIPVRLKSVHEAIDIATKEMELDPPEMEQKEEKTGFKINQMLIQVSLFTLAVVGSSYYWLDNRSDVYQPLWLMGSSFWYIAIFSSIILIHNKTRLGYLIAGFSSWVTLVFWMIDSYYVFFEIPNIENTLNELVMVRNFIGMIAVMLTVIASHNLFHKVIDYQYRGKPI